MSEHLFLVSYLLNNQPMHEELYCEEERVSVAYALSALQAKHQAERPLNITDVEVSKVTRTHKPGETPAHSKQP